MAWFEGWHSAATESAFIEWTGWTFAMALSWLHYHSSYHS